MKYLQIIFIALLFTAFGNMCTAQSTLNAAGGSNTIAGNIHEWSFGEMVLVNTASASGLVVTQGVLQSSVQTTGINDKKPALTALSIYPNPVNDQLNIKFDITNKLDVNLVVTDISGRVYFSKKYNQHNGIDLLTINFSAYANGMYMLQIESIDKGKVYLNSYKIAKH